MAGQPRSVGGKGGERGGRQSASGIDNLNLKLKLRSKT